MKVYSYVKGVTAYKFLFISNKTFIVVLPKHCVASPNVIVLKKQGKNLSKMYYSIGKERVDIRKSNEGYEGER